MSDALFGELSSADRKNLFATATTMTCDAGTIILREGEAGTKLFVIESGVVAITRQQGDTAELLTVLTKGEYFGEMALLTVEPRSATARAVEPCQCSVLTHDDFQQFVKRHPQVGAIIYRNFAITLSERVRRLTEKFERLHPRSAVEPVSHAAHAHARRRQEAEQGSLLTPSILIKGIAELLQDRDLPVEKRAYFDTVLRTQVTELAEWLKAHG